MFASRPAEETNIASTRWSRSASWVPEVAWRRPPPAEHAPEGAAPAGGPSRVRRIFGDTTAGDEQGSSGGSGGPAEESPAEDEAAFASFE